MNCEGLACEGLALPVILYSSGFLLAHTQMVGIWIPYMLCSAGALLLVITAFLRQFGCQCCAREEPTQPHAPAAVVLQCVVVESPGQEMAVGKPM